MKKQDNILTQVAGFVFFIVISIIAVVLFLDFFKPKDFVKEAELAKYEQNALSKTLNPATVASKNKAIIDLGSRSIGQKGFYDCEKYIKNYYEKAGLNILTQTYRTVFPITEKSEMSLDGKALTDVKLYPLYPNYMQPINTPPGGLTGKLVVLTDEVIDNTKDFTDMIGVINMTGVPPKKMGYSWSNYASFGMKALILTNSDGFNEINFAALTQMNSPVPVNYVRAIATPEILKYAGKQVNIQLNTKFDNIQNGNVIGILKNSTKKNSEIIVIPVLYDGYSVLPSLNAGQSNAVQIAVQLGLLDGLKSFKDNIQRDIAFVAIGAGAMAMDGENRFITAIGNYGASNETRIRIEKDLKENQEMLKVVDEVNKNLSDSKFFVDPETTQKMLDDMTSDVRNFVIEQFRYTANTIVFQDSEKLLEARIIFNKDREKDLEGKPYKDYFKAKLRNDKLTTIAAYPIKKFLITTQREDFKYDLSAKDIFVKRINELSAFHREEIKRLKQDLAINKTFADYKNLIVIAPALMPLMEPKEAPAVKKVHKEEISFTMGGSGNSEQRMVFNEVLNSTIQNLKLTNDVKLFLANTQHPNKVNSKIAGFPNLANMWCKASYPAFIVVNSNHSYKFFNYPVYLDRLDDFTSIRNTLQILGETILSISYGKGFFSNLKFENISSYHGNVYANGVGKSIVPNYPVKNALVTTFSNAVPHGYFPNIYMFTDPYGHYSYDNCLTSFTSVYSYTPEACGFGQDGVIRYMKDTSESGQRIYKSIGLGRDQSAKDVNIVVFRADPVSVFDLINPQTLKNYAGISFIRRKGLNPPVNLNSFSAGGVITTFLPPEEYYFVQLKAGSAENELVQKTRAFMLGLNEYFKPDPEKEIDGEGFLVHDTPYVLDVPFKVARSMTFLNDKRIKLQQRYGMADEMTVAYHEKAKDLSTESKDASSSYRENLFKARDSVTYSTLTHPVIRNAILEAIYGILWYLGLLVPFVFFFEKLVFGFPDIRKQLMAQSIIFIVVFVLLKILHPAFEMIRSSAMILLGFVIFLISAGITFLLSGKFKENLESLKAQQAKVKGAETNAIGVVMTSFALGLNNMHRRKVRTGLTCATLVLLTFVMISFTSVQNNIVVRTIASGKAPYQGILIKNEDFAPISPSEVFALTSKYDIDKFDICPRSVYVGFEDWRKILHKPEIEVIFTKPDGEAIKKDMKSCILMSNKDPLQNSIKFLTKKKRFFTEHHVKDIKNEVKPIIIPDKLAEKLGITPEKVDNEDVLIAINGKEFNVYSIFDSQHFDRMNDLNGKNVLPFDVEALTSIEKVGNNILADEELSPRVPAEDVIIGMQGMFNVSISGGGENITPRVTSVVVGMPDATYKKAKQSIDKYLEQSGKSAYYGLAGIAYLGQRARERSMAGLVDMLIPIVIAALTVLNTMKGSVYERKDEIFVYNAVGIAPKYIFLMFFAEAFVYSVVGSVLGYILSQGTGRILTELGWTGGLNMNFASFSTVVVSIIISLAVFVSTLFPALSAKEIAAPADESGWELPEPEGDELSFNLPFTFDNYDRIAVLGFFKRYLVNHGEGSAGPFFAGNPELELSSRTDALANDSYIPQIRTKIWLKPFDLGVSQEMVIDMATDSDTSEFIARITITRLSGTKESWHRLNCTFIKHIRRHFLHWRAVSNDMKDNLFEEVKVDFTSYYEKQNALASS